MLLRLTSDLKLKIIFNSTKFYLKPGRFVTQKCQARRSDFVRELLKDGAYLRAQAAWWMGCAGIVAVHFVWASLNSIPPAWDMAHHQIMGWRFLQAAEGGRLLAGFISISDYYPPLYYLVEAGLLGVLRTSPYLPLIANLPGLLLLGHFTFRTAWLASGSPWSAVAGLLAMVMPLVAWTTRESLLDVSLAGLVSLSLYLLVRSEALQSRPTVLLFGLAAAAGMLTKWNYALFVVPPAFYLLWRSQDRSRSLKNLFDAGLIGAPVVLWWYLPNLSVLLTRLQATAAGADWEGDPQLDSLLGWIYYPRALSSYYLFLPLTLVVVIGLIRLARKRPLPDVTRVLLVTLLGSVVLLTVLKAKDPRYVMPAAGLLAAVVVLAWIDRPKVIIGVLSVGLVQYLAISFTLPGVPSRIGFFGVPQDVDYRSMRQEWVWFASNYLGVTGPPRNESWGVRELAETLSDGARVAWVPDALRFHPGLLKLRGLEVGKKFVPFRAGLTDDWPRALEEADWVVGKTGEQGISYITFFNDDVYDALEILRWPLESTWDLPDGSRAMLWRNPSRSP